MTGLTLDLAERFAGLALGHVTREYPNKLNHVLTGPEDARGPRDLHPVFYGSFDWHSCVHGYWLLARLLRRFPDASHTGAITALFDAHLTPALVAVERAYLDRSGARGFERPYGWAWLLKLAAELEGTRWAGPVAPFAEAFAARFLAFLPLATYPVRSGVHSSTAFAIRLALDFPDEALRTALRGAARRWYSADADCQAWEPSGEDFLSPALMEAACMLAVLGPEEFRPWSARFLPRLGAGAPAALFTPAAPSDRSDGKIAHLDGLNFSRAWCWRALAPFAPDPARALAVAQAHVAASLPHVGGDYMGEHWLATFAVLALE